MCDVPNTYPLSSGNLQTAIISLGQSTSQIISSIKSPSMRPYAMAKVKGCMIKCLFDTGADVSCINSRVVPSSREDEKVTVVTSKPLKAAGGQSLKVHGAQKMELEIDGKKVTHPFLVVEDLNEPIILGIDFITRHGLNYSPSTREFSWENAKGWKQGFCTTIRTEKIPALSSKLVKVNLITTGGGKPSEEEIISSCAASESRPLISGAPGLIKHSNGVAFIQVQNCAPVAVEICRDETIGRIENLSQSKFEMIKDDVVSSVTHKPCSSADKKFIEENVNLNVPAQYKQRYLQVLQDHHQVISRSKNDLGRSNTLQHEISLKSNEPVYVKQFRIPEGHMKEVEQHLTEWLKLGVVEPCRSKYNSPLFLVTKKDGGLRVVQDFRALNEQTMEDKYSMHDVSECVAQIGRAGSTIFTTIDLTSGFWQMVLHPSSRPLTAFTIPGKGQHQWTVAPMGLLGSPASFQRLVETALKGVPNVIVYIDDLLIHTKTHTGHLITLSQVFDRLAKHNLKINLKKCFFGSQNVAYLGFRLTPKGIIPGSDKLKAVGQTPPPATVKEVRQFLGLCNFFRTHVKNFAQISSPLTALTKKDSPWKRGPMPKEAFQAYRELQSILCSEPVVAYPRSDRQYALITDAACGDDNNPGGLGAILTQIDEKGQFYVIAYASRKLAKHEKNYTAFLLEMQAAVWAMDHFDVNLRGKNFLLYTDHKPLEKLGKVHTKTLNRLQEAMNTYSFQIIYKKGSEMPADYLSRNVVDSIKWSLEDISQLQEQDALIHAIREFLFNRNLPDDPQLTKLVKNFAEDCFISDNIVWRRIVRGNDVPRVVLFTPPNMTNDLIAEAHGHILTGHDGVFKTKERLLESYYWPGMDKQILAFIKNCHKCQTTKRYHPMGKQPIQPLPQCSQPNQRIHADLFGPLKTSERGKKYILCITDAFTKYVELVAIPDKEATTIATSIFYRWVCRYGCPLQITTDNGKEFCAKISEQLFKLLNSAHLTTSPYHPQCNAQVEIVNKTIAKYLASFVDETTLDWELYLAPLMFCYNTSVHTSTKTSPHFLTYGYFPRLPSIFGADMDRVFYGENTVDEMMTQLQHARRIAAANNDNVRDKYVASHDTKIAPQTFQVSQKVLIDENMFLNKNKKLAPKYNGPFVISRVFDTNAEIIGNNNRKYIVHFNRLKPYFAENDTIIPHSLDTYHQYAENSRNDISHNIAPNQTVSNSFQRNEIADVSDSTVRRKRGRPRKIVLSNNLFETRRDENVENGNLNLNVSNSQNGQIDPYLDQTNDPLFSRTNDPLFSRHTNDSNKNAFNTNSSEQSAVINQRLTRSAIQQLSEPEKQNYFQSLNLIETKNNKKEKNKIIEIYSQKIFTIVTKKKKLKKKKKKNGSTTTFRWSRAQQRNFEKYGDIFQCVSHGTEPVMDEGHQVQDDESDGSSLHEIDGESEEDDFATASSATESENEDSEGPEVQDQDGEEVGPVHALPGAGLQFDKSGIHQPDDNRRSRPDVQPPQGVSGLLPRMPNTVKLPTGVQRNPPTTLPPSTVHSSRTSQVPGTSGIRAQRTAAPPIPGTGRGSPGRNLRDGDRRSTLSAYDARDNRPVGVQRPTTANSSAVDDMAKFLGITPGQISKEEADARIDDAIFTKGSSPPVRTRTTSLDRESKLGPQHSSGARRRSKTPEQSPREKRLKDTLSGVSHARARLVLDKRAAAENKPAQIFKTGTRSSSTAPPIWPIRTETPSKTTKKQAHSEAGASSSATGDRKESSPDSTAFRRSSKVMRTPPK